MDYENKYVSELIDIREEARKNKDWKLSDDIRDYLDTKQSFIFDTKEGQVIYHELKWMTRSKLIDKIAKDKMANKVFDSWLYSLQSSFLNKTKQLKIPKTTKEQRVQLNEGYNKK